MQRLTDDSRLALAGALALGLAASAIGAAHAVDIKMWTLVDEGYPEFIDMRDGRVQEDPSGCEHRLRELPERGLQDDDPGGADRLGAARRVLQLGRRGSARLVRDGLALDITEYAQQGRRLRESAVATAG